MKRTFKLSPKRLQKLIKDLELAENETAPAEVHEVHNTGSNQALFAHASGATSDHQTPPFALVTGYGEVNTALRFGYGNVKHEHENNVVAEANWLEAAKARDHKFFQDRFGHVREHLKKEERGIVDNRPGGNLGAIGWYQDVASFLAVHDPEFYDVVRRLRAPGNYSYPVPDYSPGRV